MIASKSRYGNQIIMHRRAQCTFNRATHLDLRSPRRASVPFLVRLRQTGNSSTQRVRTEKLLTRSGDRHDPAALYWVVNKSGSRQFLSYRPAQCRRRAPVSLPGQNFKRPDCGVAKSDRLRGEAVRHVGSFMVSFQVARNGIIQGGLSTLLVARPVETLSSLDACRRSVHVHCVTGS